MNIIDRLNVIENGWKSPNVFKSILDIQFWFDGSFINEESCYIINLNKV
jgi:hypothetical protein